MTFADSSRCHSATDAFKGTPANPLSDKDLIAKLTDCANGVIDPDRIETITEVITRTGRPVTATDLAALLVC